MQTHLHPLFLLQKKIIRLITFSPYLAHTGPIFLNLQLLPPEKIFYSRVGLVMFKCSNYSSICLNFCNRIFFLNLIEVFTTLNSNSVQYYFISLLYMIHYFYYDNLGN